MPMASKVGASEPISGSAAMGGSRPSLPQPIQEHLGRKLRAVYYEEGERPVYLGDPVIPPELASHLRQLAQRERIHNKGVEAVEAALGPILRARPQAHPSIKDPGLIN